MRSRRLRPMLALLCLVIGVSSIVIAPASQAAPCGDGPQVFSGGSGTTGSPYVIASASDLVALRDSYAHGYYACVYRQSSDIVLSISWPHGLGFSTPGSAVWAPFEGVYDGEGLAISGRTVDASGVGRASQARELGFIGLSTSGSAAVRNLNLVNASVVCGFETVYAGMLVAETSGTVERSSASGTVSCTSADAVARMGGLIGYTNGHVTNAWVSGTVTVPTTPPASFSPNAVGGVIGRSDGSASISNVLGRVTLVNYSSAIWAGVFTGYNNTGPYSSSFAQSGLSAGLNGLMGAGSSGGVSAKSASELQTISTYASWSISAGVSTSTVWGIDPAINGGFPFLQAFPTPGGEMPSILQALPVNDEGTCANLVDAHVAYQSGVSGGWGRSWAEWANAGSGGPVCVRTLIYAGGLWSIAS